MAIPDYQSIMRPLLSYAGDGEDHSLRDAISTLADQFHLTEEERRELLPSGRQPTFDNRLGYRDRKGGTRYMSGIRREGDREITVTAEIDYDSTNPNYDMKFETGEVYAVNIQAVCLPYAGPEYIE